MVSSVEELIRRYHRGQSTGRRAVKTAALRETHPDRAAPDQAGFDRLQASLGGEDEAGGLIGAGPRRPAGHVDLRDQLAGAGIRLDLEAHGYDLDAVGAGGDVVGTFAGRPRAPEDIHAVCPVWILLQASGREVETRGDRV